VTLSERDRRILLILVPIVLVLAYWFLLLSPKRDDLSKAKDAQTAAESARDQAVAQVAQLEKARQTFAADYAAVIRLGKAIPADVDAPSLLVQLDRAAKGTHIDFDSVTFGARAQATAPAPPPTPTATQGPAQPQGNAAAGGAPAQSAPGTAVESAGNTVTTANQAAQAAGGTTTTETTATAAPQAPASTTAATLDTVALTFNFRGTYFDLADFFHRLKRFVYVANNQVFVRGRLLTIDTLTFAPGAPGSNGQPSAGNLTATVGATIYLSPKATGVTGGATASGPAGSTTETTTTPSGAQTSKVPLATAGVR
jgi:hypothetical protein